MEPDTKVAIGLGSNIGDRLEHLRSAVSGLDVRCGRIESRSSIWETSPIGPDQADYLNAVVVVDTVLGPGPLLRCCLDLESEAGRRRTTRWGPRIIDLDLLLYGDAVLDAPGLSVPHPRMAERRFVLAPLYEAWPEAIIPDLGSVDSLLASVADQEARHSGLEW